MWLSLSVFKTFVNIVYFMQMFLVTPFSSENIKQDLLQPYIIRPFKKTAYELLSVMHFV